MFPFVAVDSATCSGDGVEQLAGRRPREGCIEGCLVDALLIDLRPHQEVNMNMVEYPTDHQQLGHIDFGPCLLLGLVLVLVAVNAAEGGCAGGTAEHPGAGIEWEAGRGGGRGGDGRSVGKCGGGGHHGRGEGMEVEVEVDGETAGMGNIGGRYN